MRNIKYIVIHCSAGFGDLASVKKFWKEVLGWENVGYHRFIDTTGKVFALAGLEKITNGVAGFNTNSVHICYQGGIEKVEGKIRSKDTRTVAQKKAIVDTIAGVLDELRKVQRVDGITILGHRDFSPDKNGNGVIESWERIKDCPCFDAIPEYKNIIPNLLKSL